MATADPLFAQWLQAQADFTVRSSAVMTARWGATAVTSEAVTGLATQADAEAEADRQLAFFARGPFALDVHQLVGTDWHRDRGRIITLFADQLGYADGVDVMVLETDIDRAKGISQVTVLRPLRGLS